MMSSVCLQRSTQKELTSEKLTQRMWVTQHWHLWRNKFDVMNVEAMVGLEGPSELLFAAATCPFTQAREMHPSSAPVLEEHRMDKITSMARSVCILNTEMSVFLRDSSKHTPTRRFVHFGSQGFGYTILCKNILKQMRQRHFRKNFASAPGNAGFKSALTREKHDV